MEDKLLYVALDADDRQENVDLALTLARAGGQGHFGFKINLDHALVWGEAYIEAMVGLGKPVFADLKMNNGPRTMSHVIRWLGGLGVAHTNIWANADTNFAQTMRDVSRMTDKPVVLGATFYTRWNEDYAQRHYRMPLRDLVLHWAHVAVDSGADGIILPGSLLGAVSDLNTIKLNPAVRMSGQRTNSEQEQVIGPYEAIVNGADILVVGSPIHRAPDPVLALIGFLSEIERARVDLSTTISSFYEK